MIDNHYLVGFRVNMSFQLKLIPVSGKSPSEVLEIAQATAFKNLQQNLTQAYMDSKEQSSERDFNSYMENFKVTIESDGVTMDIDGWKPSIQTRSSNPIDPIQNNSDNIIDAAFKSAFDTEG
jgi:hypothetical protein